MFGAIFVIILIIFVLIFGFVLAMFISPKFKGKIMSSQVKASKYMMDESKEDFKSISDNMAYATKDGIKTTARAIKEGFADEKVYCKHCGDAIDKDSKFCKKCGKEQ